jgi:hypothetical protein
VPLLREGGGGGLVRLVTRLVKSPTLPITFCEKFCMPPTTEAAKAAPGRPELDGRDEGVGTPVEIGREVPPIPPAPR